MGADRDQELEQRIDELEATVRGLTEELVDLTERMRRVEEAADLEESPEHTTSLPEQSDVTEDPVETPETDSTDEPEEGTEDADEIIVA